MSLKPKTRAMADKLLADPKLSSTQAYLDTHKTTNRPTANAASAKLLAKPEVKVYMQTHVKMAKERMVYLAQHAKKEDTQLKAITDILDRNEGKAIQRTETRSTNLNLNIEASDELADTFTQFLKQQNI